MHEITKQIAEVKKNSEMQRVTVDINGDVYHLLTDDPEGLEKIVQMVNFTMKAISQNTRTFSGSRIGVMAALRIAEDYMQLKKDYDELLALLKENQ